MASDAACVYEVGHSIDIKLFDQIIEAVKINGPEILAKWFSALSESESTRVALHNVLIAGAGVTDIQWMSDGYMDTPESQGKKLMALAFEAGRLWGALESAGGQFKKGE